MDRAGQDAGEKRVQELLIDPLQRRGLAKPSSLTKAEFEAMKAGLCAKLAYLSDVSLGALEEVVAANPAGKDRDRLPIANRILEWAGQIQPPGDDASPLLRAFFAHADGQRAIAEGWAPELLQKLRANRQWPGRYLLDSIRDGAGEAVRQMVNLDARLARGDELTADEARWRAQRSAALDRCRVIAAMSQGAS